MLESLLNFFQSEFLLATGLQEFAAIVRSGDLEQLWSLDGAGALLALSIPGLLAIEIFATWLRGSFRWRNFRMQLFNRKVEFRGIVHRHLHGIVWHQRIWRVLWSGSLYSQ